MVALVAPGAHEAVRKDAATQVAAQLALDVPGQRGFVRLARVLEEGREVGADHAVEHRLRRPARSVRGREHGHGAARIADGVPATGFMISRSSRRTRLSRTASEVSRDMA